MHRRSLSVLQVAIYCKNRHFDTKVCMVYDYWSTGTLLHVATWPDNLSSLDCMYMYTYTVATCWCYMEEITWDNEIFGCEDILKPKWSKLLILHSQAAIFSFMQDYSWRQGLLVFALYLGQIAIKSHLAMPDSYWLDQSSYREYTDVIPLYRRAIGGMKGLAMTG